MKTNKKCKDELNIWIQDHENMIWSIVHRFTNNPSEIEDCFQEACVGVVLGYPKYSKEREAKLSTYLYSCATNQLRMKFRSENAKSRKPDEYVTSFEEMAEQRRLWDEQQEDGTPAFKGEMAEISYSTKRNLNERAIEDQYSVSELLELVCKEVTREFGKNAVTILIKSAEGYSQDQIAASIDISQSSLSTQLKKIRAFVNNFDWANARLKKKKVYKKHSIPASEITQDIQVPTNIPRIKTSAEKKGTTNMVKKTTDSNQLSLHIDPQKIAIADNVFYLLGYTRKNNSTMMQYRNAQTNADIYISDETVFKEENGEKVGMTFTEIKAADTAVSVMYL